MSGSLDRLISTLNSIHIGELDRILSRLEGVRTGLREIHRPELEDCLDQAQRAIQHGDLGLFRKRIQHLVSRLGHLR